MKTFAINFRKGKATQETHVASRNTELCSNHVREQNDCQFSVCDELVRQSQCRTLSPDPAKSLWREKGPHWFDANILPNRSTLPDPLLILM